MTVRGVLRDGAIAFLAGTVISARVGAPERARLLPASPLPETSTHPSTRVLEEVFASIARFAGAGACAKVIVADGVKMREGDVGTRMFRPGVVTRDAEAKYRHYLRRVKRLTLTKSSVLYGARLLILTERHGFAHALRRGICRAVRTPFVLVAQHDRSFVRAVVRGGLARAQGRAKEQRAQRVRARKDVVAHRVAPLLPPASRAGVGGRGAPHARRAPHAPAALRAH